MMLVQVSESQKVVPGPNMPGVAFVIDKGQLELPWSRPGQKAGVVFHCGRREEPDVFVAVECSEFKGRLWRYFGKLVPKLPLRACIEFSYLFYTLGSINAEEYLEAPAVDPSVMRDFLSARTKWIGASLCWKRMRDEGLLRSLPFFPDEIEAYVRFNTFAFEYFVCCSECMRRVDDRPSASTQAIFNETLSDFLVALDRAIADLEHTRFALKASAKCSATRRKNRRSIISKGGRS